MKNGARGDNLLAPSVLSVKAFYAVSWKRDIDYTGLARKRWIDKWPIHKIVAESEMGRTTVIAELARISRDPSLVKDGSVRRAVRNKKRRFMGRH